MMTMILAAALLNEPAAIPMAILPQARGVSRGAGGRGGGRGGGGGYHGGSSSGGGDVLDGLLRVAKFLLSWAMLGVAAGVAVGLLAALLAAMFGGSHLELPEIFLGVGLYAALPSLIFGWALPGGRYGKALDWVSAHFWTSLIGEIVGVIVLSVILAGVDELRRKVRYA